MMIKPHRQQIAAACSAVMATLLLAQLALAADTAPSGASAPDPIEEIIVTAQRREETLQNTSLAMQVVTSSDLKNAGVAQIFDLDALVPGLVIGSAAVPQIYIRGVGDFGSTPITNPAVALNADGVYLALTQVVQGDFFDIARVEVLKGPQGTLYGRNASGGAINIISNRPSLDSVNGYAEVAAGNYGLGSVEGAVNLPIDSQLALRFAGQSVSRNGYLSDGSDDDHHQSARIQGLWKTDTTSLLLGTDYTHLGGTGQGYGIVGFASAGSSSPWTASTAPGFAPYFYAASAAQGLCIPSAFFPTIRNPGACPSVAPYPSPPFPPGLTGPYTSVVEDVTGAQAQNDTYWRFRGEFVADLGPLTFTVLPAYQKASVALNVFPAGFEYFQAEDEHATSVETRLSQTSESLKWVGGLYYFDERQDSHEFIDAGLVQNNTPVTDQFTRSEAAFGELTWSFLGHTRLIAGARYTKDTKDIDGTVSAMPPSIKLLPPVPINPCFAALPANCLLETYSGSADFDKFTWKAGLEQDLSPENMLFATASTGFKAGGFDQNANTVPGSTQAERFNPETLTAYELGSHNRFLNDRLQANFEGFYWRYKDHQEPFITIDGQGQIAFDYQNAGNARLYGLDADLVFKASSLDTLRAIMEWEHSRYDTFDYNVPANASGAPFVRGAGNGFASNDPLSPLAANTGCATSTITSGTYAGGVHVDCSGFSLTHAPEWSGRVDYSHRFPLSNGANLTATIDGRFATSRWLAADFVGAEDAPGYFTEDALLSYASASNRWSVSVFGRNLGNRAIYNGAIQSPYTAGFVTATLDPPRIYGARASVKF